MKKLKFLPSVLMLVLCLAVLAVGIYAIKPTQNTIEGTITIGATNPHVVITAYKTAALNEDGTEATANKLVGPLDARAGAKLQIAEALEFDVDEANTLADVDDVVIVLKIENKSNKELGAYFYEGLSTDVMPEEATIDNVRTSYLFKQNAEDADEDAVINTSFTGYSYIAPYVSDEDDSNITYMQITFSLNQFKEYTSNFNFPLNIESYNVALDTETQGLMLNVTEELVDLAISKDPSLPTTIEGNKSLEILDDIYLGITNLVYTPESTQLAEVATAGDDLNEIKFSFDFVCDSPMYEDLFAQQGLGEVTAETLIQNEGISFYVGNYSSYEEFEECNPQKITSIGASGSTITIYETEETANLTQFCLYYTNFGDLKFSFSTPEFSENEKLEIPESKYEIRDFDSLVGKNKSITQEYALIASDDANITQKISITNSKLNGIPEEVKAVNIYANVAKGNMYLMQADKYNSLSSTKTLSEIIAQIELANDVSNRDIYVSTGFTTEEENVTMFEVPSFWCSNGSLSFVSIILSDTTEETLQVNYSIEYSNQIVSDLLIYTLVEDATNGNYYKVSGGVSDKVEEIVVPATYNGLNVKEIVVDFEFTNYLKKADLTGATNLISIGDKSFFYCKNLTNITIPANVTSIGVRAFEGCSSLTSIVIPANVTSLEGSPFSYCSGLESITVADGNTVYTSANGANAIIEITTNTLIAGCKNTVIPDTVKVIGNSAFSGCAGLDSIYIPLSITSIEQWAFDDCASLTSIHIPANVASIGGGAFSGCSGLESITVADGNTAYTSANGANAIIEITTNTLIAGCKNTIIPNTVTCIGTGAFSSCTGLTSIIIPEGVTSIGNIAFSGCENLTSITIPNTVTSIDVQAFYFCSSLTDIIISDSVTSIGFMAFSNIPDSAFTIENGIKYIKSKTNNYFAVVDFTSDIPANVTINDGCKIIGPNAFQSCTNLTSITIPASITTIGSQVFDGCSSLATITVKEGTEATFNCTLPYNYTLTNGETSEDAVSGTAIKRAASGDNVYTKK